MRILQIVNPGIPFPPKTIGGTERVVQYLINELLALGHEVTLMGHNDSIVPDSVKFIPIGTYLDQTNTRKIIWKHLLTNKYDVIHNHGRLIYFLPRLWSSVRKVHTFHMANIETPSFHRFLKARAKNFTLSPCAKWIQEQHKHLFANWQYVYNGLPKDKYAYSNVSVSEDAPLVIICRIGESKGVLDAVEIAKKSNRKLIIAGKPGDYPHEVEWFENHIAQYIGGEQIKFVGEINDEQKQQILSTSAALLMLSVSSEAFNLTMIEANACGCPVLTYNRYFGPDFIKPGVNGFIGSTQDDLVRAVGKLSEIDREECRKEFERHYTAAIMTAEYIKIYNSSV